MGGTLPALCAGCYEWRGEMADHGQDAVGTVCRAALCAGCYKKTSFGALLLPQLDLFDQLLQLGLRHFRRVALPQSQAGYPIKRLEQVLSQKIELRLSCS